MAQSVDFIVLLFAQCTKYLLVISLLLSLLIFLAKAVGRWHLSFFKLFNSFLLASSTFLCHAVTNSSFGLKRHLILCFFCLHMPSHGSERFVIIAIASSLWSRHDVTRPKMLIRIDLLCEAIVSRECVFKGNWRFLLPLCRIFEILVVLVDHRSARVDGALHHERLILQVFHIW